MEQDQFNFLLNAISVKGTTLALKAKVTKDQTSDDGESQDGSDEDEENDEEINLMVKNVRKFLRISGKFRSGNRFGNRDDRDSRNKVGRGRGYENQGVESSSVNGTVTITMTRITS